MEPLINAVMRGLVLGVEAGALTRWVRAIAWREEEYAAERAEHAEGLRGPDALRAMP